MKRFKDNDTLVAHIPKGGIGLELGVAKGRFSKILRQNTKPEYLYLVDAWTFMPGDYASSGDKCAKASQKEQDINYAKVRKWAKPLKNVEIVRGWSQDVAELFEPNSLDWVYLDACHLVKCVEADLASWWDKVKPGGWVLGHDYLDNGKHIFVKPVVDKFLAERGLAVELLSNAKYPSWGVHKTCA